MYLNIWVLGCGSPLGSSINNYSGTCCLLSCWVWYSVEVTGFKYQAFTGWVLLCMSDLCGVV